MRPAFSVVMAVYNRSRHIVPTIKSVLQQSFADFELIMVGDCCTDDTAAVVRPFLSDRVIWRNLETRGGNQFGPNNAGIELARGRYVAYIGHDDIWAPDHLAALNRAFTEQAADFAVSGCICYGPPGSGIYLVMGLFESDGAQFEHHFPPSSFAHRREAIRKFGPWRSPTTMSCHTDPDFLLRAAAAGLKFASTGTITAHKIAADLGRYLCYVRQESAEQEALLQMVAERDFPAFTAAVVDRARDLGLYMSMKHPDYSRMAPGVVTERAAKSRGLVRPALATLNGRFRLEQTDERRGMDWKQLQAGRSKPFRWSGPNPRPRMLLPLVADHPVDMRIVIMDASAGALARLSLRVNGVARPWTFKRRYQGNRALLRCITRLKPNDHSVIEFDMTAGASTRELLRDIKGRQDRLAAGSISVRPLRWYKRLWPWPVGSMQAAE